MLKNIGYEGNYRDENIAISVTLENPLNCGLDAKDLVFGVVVKGKQNHFAVPHIGDFKFCIMDEHDLLHNALFTPNSTENINSSTDNAETALILSGFIHTDLQPAFLFHDLRVSFYYRKYGRMEIIALENR